MCKGVFFVGFKSKHLAGQQEGDREGLCWGVGVLWVVLFGQLSI